MCKRCFDGDPIPRVKYRSKNYRRLKDTKALAAPFLAKAGEMKCLRCAGPRRERQKICDDCAAWYTRAAQVKAQLRSYAAKNNVKCLQTAVATIQRYGIKPEDLERV